MNCQRINNIPFSHIFSKIGIEPTKQKNKATWYKSPFREERTASFKVNLETNRYYDFGEGIGGTVVDFWCKYKSCDVKTTIKEVSSLFSFSEQKMITKPIFKRGSFKKSEPRIVIHEVKPLFAYPLKKYLTGRGLSQRIYPYIKEVNYENSAGRFDAIGFKNDLEGFELRNEKYKGCSSKTITSLIKEDSTTLSVFEGFIDFLSYLERTQTDESFLILNSLAMSQKAKTLFTKFEKVKLFLDNDSAGKTLTRELFSEFSNVIDQSSTYGEYEDYNDFHVSSL